MMGIRCPATLVEFNDLKFLITGMPNKCGMRSYIQELLQYNTKQLVKVCEGNYDITPFQRVGIEVNELIYQDGTFPPPDIIHRWLDIVRHHFSEYSQNDALAVHCSCGLGRSAVLVAIALMESGMAPPDAVTFIRTQRKGAFNECQLEQLHKYQTTNFLLEIHEKLE